MRMLSSLSRHPQTEGASPFTLDEAIAEDVCLELKRLCSLSGPSQRLAGEHRLSFLNDWKHGMVPRNEVRAFGCGEEVFQDFFFFSGVIA